MDSLSQAEGAQLVVPMVEGALLVLLMVEEEDHSTTPAGGVEKGMLIVSDC